MSFNVNKSIILQKIAESDTWTTVSAAVTLNPSQQRINVVTPAAEGDYQITLPPVAECADMDFLFVANNTGGGEVTVDDAGEGIADLSVGDNLSADGDYIWIHNVGGMLYVCLAEVTT